jgi:CSLREA domain-containing protein
MSHSILSRLLTNMKADIRQLRKPISGAARTMPVLDSSRFILVRRSAITFILIAAVAAGVFVWRQASAARNSAKPRTVAVVTRVPLGPAKFSFSIFTLVNAVDSVISGQVLTTGGAGAMAAGKPITLLQNGAVAGTGGVTDSFGNYSISGVTLATGNKIAVFIDDVSEKGATVLLSNGSDVSNLNIIQNDLIVRADTGAISNADLSAAQGSGTPDPDLTAVYTVTGGALTTPAGVSLQVWSGAGFTPGGNINDGGNWINNGTFNAGANTVTFNGNTNQTISGNTTSFSTLTIHPATGGLIVSLAQNAVIGTALNIQTGVFSQGEAGPDDFSLTTNVVTVSAGATWRNLGKGDLFLTGGVNNSGTINFNANGAACEEVATNDIQIRSLPDSTPRTWSGSGTFSMTDVDVKDQTAAGLPTLPAVIIVNSGTDSTGNTRWSFTNTCAGPYTWIGGASQDWTVPTNWSPVRSSAALPTTTDILIFDGNITPTPIVNNVPSQEIAKLSLVNNNINVTLHASGSNTIKIVGVSGNDLSIAAGTTLAVAGSSPLQILLIAGSRGTVDGQIILQEAAHKIVGTDGSPNPAVTFSSTSFFTDAAVPTGFSGNPFGTGTDGSVIFQSGSQSFFQAGDDPFGGSGKSIVVFNGGSKQTFTASSAFSANGRTYGYLTLGGSQTYFDSTATTQLTVFNDLLIQSGSTLKLSDASGGDLNLLANFSDSGTFNANGRTVKFQGGTAVQTVSKSSGAESFFDVFVSLSTGGAVKLLSPLTIAGQLNLSTSASVVELNSQTLTLNGTVTGTGGLKGDPGASMIIGGTGSLGTLNFISGARSLSSLSVNRISGSVTLATDLSIGGSLTLTAGVINTANTLFLGSAATAASSGGYVIGNLQKSFGASGNLGNFLFPVGTANGSSVLDANVTANNSGTLTVKAVQGKQPNISGTNALQRYWILSGSGLTTDLTFHYNVSSPNDIVGSEALYKIFKYDGSFTLAPNQSINTTAHTATATGVSSFSDWTLAEPTAVQAGTLQFVGAPYTDSETDTTHTKTITVSRTGGSDGAVDVTYATSGGTATAGSDYVETTGTLHWNNGETGSKTFDITVNGDTTYEANETVNITLSNVTDGATITPPNPTTLTITNDDPVPASAILVVNTTDDNDFGACVTEHCSLREAINAANSLPDTNTISFNIPGGGVRTITPGTALPTITQPANLNGYSQPLATANTLAVGDDANLLIELDGTSAGAGASGLEFGATAGSSSVRGLIINRFGLDGVRLTSNSGCVVAGNFIGTNAAGTAASGNLHGVFVNGANNSTIGGTTAADRNIISGSKPGGNQGVQIAGTVTGNVVKGNYIGTNAAGTAAVPNSGDGIRVVSSTSTVIGGTTALEANVIAGNTLSGIRINGDGTVVKGNFIGTNSAGAVLGNGDAGIQIVSANNSIIGGAAAGEANTIANSGNGKAGVFVQSGTGNAIRANSIHDNGGLGIDLGTGGLTANDTGDPDTGANNLQNFPVITSSKVTGPTKTIKGTLNSIASQSFTIEFFANTTCDGSGNGEGSTYLGSTPVTTDGSGNGSFTFHPVTLSVGDVITATATDSGNNTSEFSACFTTIAGTPGTLQFSAANTNDTELNSSTHPVTITVTRTGGLDGDVSVHYATSDGTATAGSDYDATSGDFTWLEGDGASKTFDVTIHGDTTYEANETVNLTLSSVQVASLGSPSTATITIINDDTPPATLTVNTTDDNDFTACLVAHCSLREAINAANFNVDTNTINFDISISDPQRNSTTGVFTISPASALPTITNPVTVNGYTQTPCATNSAPCAKENTLTVGSDAVLLIEINGANAGGYGLRMSASNSTIKGLVINRSTQSEIEITGAGDVVRGNFLGSDASGTADLGNTVRAGIEINGTNGNTIGGSSAAERNVISGGNGWGIFLINGASGNTVRNNYIGTDKTGTADLGNTNDGVLIDNRTNNSILGNLISGNDANGILIRNNSAGGTANIVRGNLIGTKSDGTTGLGNGGHGIKDERTAAGSSDGNTIGGTGAGEANTIAFNGGDGVFVNSSDPAFITGTSIRGNSIYSNTGLGIDLAPDGVTPNDANDPDTGANNLQNFPIITEALVGGTNTIKGTLNSTPGQTFTIDFYDSPTCDGSGNGEGKVYLGSTITTTTDGNGDVSFSFVTTAVTAGDYITATATDSAGNTSEFSACLQARTYVAGTIGFAQANTDNTETDSSSHAVDITVNRTGGTDGAVSVDYAVTNGTATTADNDYSVSPASGTFNWPNGDSSSRTITITVNGDTKFELDETVNLALSSPTGGATLGTGSATLTIKNDDSQPAISIDNVSHSEGNAGTTDYDFTVSLSNASYQTVTVNAATTDDTAQTSNSDYTAVSTPLTFTPDQTTKHVHVLVNGDLTVENNEQFFVDLSAESNASVAKRRGVGTIVNDDTDVTIAVSTASVAEDGTTNLVYTFTRNPLTSGPITVNFSVGGTATFGTNPGDDYTETGAATFNATSGTVIIPNGATTATVTIDPTADLTVEPDETVILTVISGTGYNVGTNSSATGTITNDDTDITVAVSPTAVAEDDPLTNPVMVYIFTRTGITSGAITVNFSVSGSATFPSDYAASGAASFGPSSGTVTFGDGVTSAMVTIDPATDAVYESNETVILTVTSGTGYNPGTPASATGTIINNDTAPTLSIGDKIANEGTVSVSSPGPTTNFVFTVTRTGNTEVAATVHFATGDGITNPATGGVSCGSGVDYETQSGTLTFPASAGPNSQTITIKVCKDSTVESNETFFVTLDSPTDATIADGEGRGTIQNDDSPGTVLVVNTTDDVSDGICDAHCTLREAITALNGSVAPDAVGISFAIPAGDPRHFYYSNDGVVGQVTNDGSHVFPTSAVDDTTIVGIDPDWPHSWWSILPTTALPPITHRVVVDGYTQTGATANDGLTAGDNAVLRIELNGASAGGSASGLILTASISNLRGLVVNRFSSHGLDLQGGTSNSVVGAFIGSDVSGTLDLGNTVNGLNTNGNSLTIGGSTPADVNLISGNNGTGIAFANSNSDLVLGNLIGTKANGTSALGNSGNGISFTGAGSGFNTIGGTQTGDGNTIAFNGGDGVQLPVGVGVGTAIRGNSISSNGTTSLHLGIDLGADGVTPNDAKDPDTGANNLQNFPLITQALVTGSTKTIKGTLNSKVSEIFEIDFYASSSCDTSGNGEGQTYLGSVTTSATDANGDVSFTFHPDINHASGMTIGKIITATATSTGASSSTSEFSLCFPVSDGSSGAGDIQFTSATYSVAENVASPHYAAITLTRVGGSNGSISSTFTTSNGTATSGSDFNDATQTVTFLEGETSQTINVTINDDSIYEGDETVGLSLGTSTINAVQPDGTFAPAVDPHAAVLTIVENDPKPTFAITSNVTHAEGDTGTTSYVFTVTKSGSTALNASVDYATVNGTATAPSDYTAIPATTLTFLPADTTKQFTVLVNGDTTVEPDEAFAVHLSNAVNATISSADGTGSITNDDTDVTVSVSPLAVAEDGAPNLVYTFTRTGVTTGSLTVNFSVGGTATLGTDYTQTGAATFTTSSGTVTFGAGLSTKTVTIDPSSDATVEADETVLLTVTSGTGYNVASPSAATGTITNDDTDVTVAVSPASVSEDGVANLVYTFTRTGVTSGALTVNFSVGGTATSGTDYTQTGAATFSTSSGTVSFGAGNATATVTVDPTPDIIFEPNETVILTVTAGTGYNTGSPSAATGTINNDDAAGGIIQFTANTYNTTENSRSVTVTVERLGSTSGAVTANYATPDDSEATTVTPCSTNSSGFASPRCDFTTALGTVRFADGDATPKTFDILISQDTFVEPPELLTVTLSNLTGPAVFGANTTATVRIDDDDLSAPVSNPIDDPQNFVRQHYHDFLNREPDASGLAFWTNEISSCGSNQQCIDFKRVQVSAAFYLSIEFQDTGYLVERLYKSSYGDANGASTFNGAHSLTVPVVRFSEFLGDTQEIGQGVVVGAPGWPPALENNKAAFADKFVQRARFVAAFPLSMTPAQFVDKLNLNAGNPLSQAERDQLVADLTSNAKTRAQVLRAVADDQDLKNSEFNRAFVLMQYFGYLRRNPNVAPDSDYSGYDFWLTKLNQFNGNFQNADMVKAFITSSEYRNRSGP